MNAVEQPVSRLPPELDVQLPVLKRRLHSELLLWIRTHLVPRGGVAVDVGASHGPYSVAVARRVRRKGQVHAIEPYPPSAGHLRALARRRRNVMVHELAPSDRSGTATLAVPVFRGRELDALARLVAPAEASIRGRGVTTETLDHVLQDVHGADVVQCDVEGHEDEVLSGASRTLRTFAPPVVAELEQRHGSRPPTDTRDRFPAQGHEGYCLTAAGLWRLAASDVERDQLSLLPAAFVPHSMPTGYLNDFPLVRRGTDVRHLLASEARRPRPRGVLTARARRAAGAA